MQAGGGQRPVEDLEVVLQFLQFVLETAPFVGNASSILNPHRHGILGIGSPEQRRSCRGLRQGRKRQGSRVWGLGSEV